MGMTNRPAWTLTEAAERTKASRSTLRRYHEAGKFPHAYKDSRNQWRFPIEDLLAAGVELVKASPTEQAQDAQPEQAAPAQLPTTPDAEAQRRLHELELQLAVEREKNEGLQRLVEAAETGRNDLRRALLILEAPKPAPVEQASAPAPAEPFAMGPAPAAPQPAQQPDAGTERQPDNAEAEHRPGWFARWFG